MAPKNIIKISSSLHKEFTTKVSIGGETYLVHTDIGTDRNPTITTHVYLKGSILDTFEKNYALMLNRTDAQEQVIAMMREQHERVVKKMQSLKRRQETPIADYLIEIRKLIEKKEFELALSLAEEKLEVQPKDPFLLSYVGYLGCAARKDYRNGIQTCKNAIDILKRRMPFGQDYFYPIFYVNLGKAYLAAGRRKDAVETFRKGLAMDRENKELISILEGLGLRREPLVPFLERSNAVNKYLGRMLSGLQKKPTPSA